VVQPKQLLPAEEIRLNREPKWSATALMGRWQATGISQKVEAGKARKQFGAAPPG